MRVEEKRLLCRFCKLKNNCDRKDRKEKYEQAGFGAYCLIGEYKGRLVDGEKWEKRKEEGKRNAARR
ncbi:Uncharacterised protein [Mycobacteroides abscessus subsp. abscessus]|nr:Uncharacterised protein [Mycobacteroides abscessus subsp. abscessus]